MARFFTLGRRGGVLAVAGGLGWLTTFATGLQANPPTTNAAPVTPAATMKPAAPTTLALTNTAGLPPDTLGRYGKIVAPGTELAHPLRLNLPLPDVGEIKVPSQDELVMRDKLEQLALLSDADIRTQLAAWPAFSKMNLRDEGAMLGRIQDFRDHRSKMAQATAHQLGLVLTPEQQAHFEKDYWTKRLQMEHDLAKQFEPLKRAREQKMLEELFREFSVASTVPTPAGAKPPTPGAAPAKSTPGQPPMSPTPVAETKPMTAQAPQ